MESSKDLSTLVEMTMPLGHPSPLPVIPRPLSVIPSVVEGSLHSLHSVEMTNHDGREISPCATLSRDDKPAEVKASSPIRTSLYEREGSMRGSLKRPSLRPGCHFELAEKSIDDLFPWTFKAICKRLGIPVPLCLRPENINKPISAVPELVALGPRPLATNGTQEGPSMVELSRSDDSDLCHEMLTTFGFTQDQMHRAAERFHLGRSKSGQTIYWMIDDMGRCLDGRLGDTWVSTLLKARYPAAAPYLTVEHCLFGLHQVSLNDKKPIGIVQSERSAVILSELCPDLMWMAYSYPSNLMVDVLEPLQGHKVTLYPLADPYMDNYLYCLDLADRARKLYHLDISVSRFLEDNATDAQKQRNIDLLEFMLEK